MNGRTSKLINRAARKLGARPRDLKRAWYRANKIERTGLRKYLKNLCVQD